MIRLRLLASLCVLGLFLFGGTAPSQDRPQQQLLNQNRPGTDGHETGRSVKTSSPRPSRSDATPRALSPPDSAVAVVELFTSEGCSSCPPADRLLKSLVERARAEGRPIYALSFHVDYWNRLGWEDPYSDAKYSQRQRRYAQTLNVDTYTPQIVVNGQQAMVGSRSGQVRNALESALAESASVDVRLQITETDELSVDYRLSESPPDKATLRLAVVERGLSQDVTRGENAGRTLQHANVVRSFETISARRQGTVQLTVPDAVDRSQASVIAYVQTSSLAVLGAARKNLGEEPSAPAR